MPRAMGIILLCLVIARPCEAVRLNAEIFLGDLNDFFFGAGEQIVFEIDAVTGTITIDEQASNISLLGQPMSIGLNASLDSKSGLYLGTGFLNVPQIGVVGFAEHADGGVQEANSPPGPVDVSDGLGVGAMISLLMQAGCKIQESGGGVALPRHFAECDVTLFLTATVVSEEFSDVDCAVAAAGARCEDGNACTGSDICVAGACVSGAPLSCDDGDPCTDDVCDPAAGCVHTDTDFDHDGACAVDDNCPTIFNPAQTDVDPADGIGDACECRAASPGVCVLDGKGPKSGECIAEWRTIPVPEVVAAKGVVDRKIECEDGAACDQDSQVNGACRFRVAACFNNQDPRLSCTPDSVEIFRLKRPKRTSKRPGEAEAAEAILDSVAGLGLSKIEGKKLDRAAFSPALSTQDLCGPYVDVDVPIKGSRGRMKISTLVFGGATRDKDTLKLFCVP